MMWVWCFAGFWIFGFKLMILTFGGGSFRFVTDLADLGCWCL